LVWVGEIKSRHIIGDPGALSDAIDDVAAGRIGKRRRISKKLATVVTGVRHTGRFEIEEVTFSHTVGPQSFDVSQIDVFKSLCQHAIFLLCQA
jgi:hypothetical protein